MFLRQVVWRPPNLARTFQHYLRMRGWASYWWFNQFSRPGVRGGGNLYSLFLRIEGATYIKFGDGISQQCPGHQGGYLGCQQSALMSCPLSVPGGRRIDQRSGRCMIAALCDRYITTAAICIPDRRAVAQTHCGHVGHVELLVVKEANTTVIWKYAAAILSRSRSLSVSVAVRSTADQTWTIMAIMPGFHEHQPTLMPCRVSCLPGCRLYSPRIAHYKHQPSLTRHNMRPKKHNAIPRLQNSTIATLYCACYTATVTS